MKGLLIRRARLLDPGRGIDRRGDLLIADGRIAWSGQALPPDLPLPSPCPTLEARGLVLAPGFIDLHCHLRQPGFEEAETIASGTTAAARGGFTTLCAMADTQPPLDTAAALEFVQRTAAAEGVVRVLPVGCVDRKSVV